MSMRTVLIRADATPEIGTGHVMRCLALAQAWQDSEGLAVYVMARSTPAVRSRLAAEDCRIQSIDTFPGSAADAEQTVALVRQYSAEWLVLDGYEFNSDYQRKLRGSGCRILCIDDLGKCDRYFAHVILNQNVTAQESWYAQREPGAQLLLGSRYCLLRREFLQLSDALCGARHGVLVTLGGSTPRELGLLILEVLSRLADRGIASTFVGGGSSPDIDCLVRRAAGLAPAVMLAVDPPDMARLMSGATLAVSAAGSTCWELCFLGVPTILTALADNQVPVAEELSRSECAVYMGDSRALTIDRLLTAILALAQSPQARSNLSQRCRTLVDGRGAERVVAALLAREAAACSAALAEVVR